MYKYGKRRMLWNIYDLNATRIFKFVSIVKWFFIDGKQLKSELEKKGITGVRVYNFRGWHEGTSTFLGKEQMGQQVFIKRSIFSEAISSEIRAIEYIKEKSHKTTFDTCTVLNSGRVGRYSYVVEEFLDGFPMNDNINLVDEEIINKLIETVEEFHRIGLYHCDFTPKNIFISANGITVIDFEYSYCEGDDIRNTRLYYANKRKMKMLGGEYSFENGVIDDTFSLAQIIKKHYYQFALTNKEKWKKLNLGIGLYYLNLDEAF